ncbi:MAG: hypothetical protein IKC72_00485 [Clostridia bacterium]|nr:hypothetical protein [Clostridia bacterium]
MAYSIEKRARMEALIGDIQGRKAHEYAAPTYEDAKAMSELFSLVKDAVENDGERDTLVDSIVVLSFLAEGYDGMGRFVVSARVYGMLLHLAFDLKRIYGEDTAGIADIFYRALRARNAYVDDACKDIVALAYGLMEKSAVDAMVCERMAHPRTLKRDAVEMTDEYLAVIDEVEKKVEENRTFHGHGSCHEVWMLKSMYLAERGIVWHSLGELNPRVHFD